MTSKFRSELFLAKKTYDFWGWVPQKMTEIESLSDFDEIWYIEVFKGADFKNCIYFYVYIAYGIMYKGHMGYVMAVWGACARSYCCVCL